MTTDVKNYQVELKSKESELQSLRKDVTIKTTQIGVMDKNLQQTRSLLENKNDLGKPKKTEDKICLVKRQLRHCGPRVWVRRTSGRKCTVSSSLK